MNNTEKPISTPPRSLVNPYRGIEQTNDWHRITQDLSKTDVFRLKNILMDHGCIQTIMNLYVKHLTDYVLTNKLESLVPEHRQQLIDHVLTITGNDSPITSGPTEGESSGHGPVQDVGGTTPGVREASESQTDQPAANPGEPATAKGKGGKGGRRSNRTAEAA